MLAHMARILLINPRDSHWLVSPPLGVGYLVAYAQKVGKNEVCFHDENVLPISSLNLELEEVIQRFRPDFIGLTFPSSTVLRVVEIVRYLKVRHPGIVRFAGGYHPTSEPEATLRIIPELDFIILDQAEHAFAHLGDDWRSAETVCYLTEEGKFVENPRRTIIAIDDIPYVDRGLYAPAYFEPHEGVMSGIYGRTVTMMTSRGCPYRCKFCSNELLQKDVSFHSVDYVIGEIEQLRRQVPKIDYLYFLDVMFLTNWRRTEALCEALIKSKVLGGIKWGAVVAANVTTEPRARLMREAGCFYLSFGLESNSAKSLKLMKKVAKPKDNERAAQVCQDLGILFNSAFLFGIPGESEEDLQATVDFVKRFPLFATGVNTMKPLPGSPYYYEFVQEGRIERSIADWHRISSINHDSGYFNAGVSPEVYKRYERAFEEAVRRVRLAQYYEVNVEKLIEYGATDKLRALSRAFEGYRPGTGRLRRLGRGVGRGLLSSVRAAL
jgi:anaerobic magnesium-protoporphyrin IX monomethyl ester cyclase